jgi:(E)-4-hydroxy-3-methylbut-2-enyl-diphosphate synthase
MKILPYCSDVFHYSRRQTLAVRVGDFQIGGGAPILVQSMTNTSTKDVDATVMQTLELAQAGCEMVRITAPTVKDAELLQEIVAKVRAAGSNVAISADIHFQPKAAFEALKWVDKVRINPGNFVDKGVHQTDQEWSDSEFEQAQQKVNEYFGAFVREAAKYGRAIRIGVNHGSLSARMVYKYGDTVEGMVQSALEFARVCEQENFDQVVFSMKSSNPRVAMQAYRQLASRLDTEHKPYPLHIGVTEAGNGQDARLKSAAGIGSLLLDGLGDTIRVSLTESPVAEVPVARELIRQCTSRVDRPVPKGLTAAWHSFLPNPYSFTRRASLDLQLQQVAIGGANSVRVGGESGCDAQVNLLRCAEWSDSELRRLSIVDAARSQMLLTDRPLELFVESTIQLEDFVMDLPKDQVICWSYVGEDPLTGYRALAAFLHTLKRQDPIVLRYRGSVENGAGLRVAAWLGALLGDGIGDAVSILDEEGNAALSYTYDLLQATGVRKSKAEYIACPSCGRTLFDIETVLADIRNRTGHLKDVSIAVMGCIVNGPGEMADADFGYVGGAPGKISLYEGKQLVKKNVPQAHAIDELVQLLIERGRWVDPAVS